MSKITKPQSSSPEPPFVPTQFTGDDGSISVPVGNNENLLTGTTSDYNNNEIQSRMSGDTSRIQLTNYLNQTATTTDTTPNNILTLSLSPASIGATPGVFKVEGEILAYNTTDSLGATYKYVSGFVTDGATATEIGTELKDIFEQSGMASCDFSISASGNNMVITVTGIAGKTINWRAIAKYKYVGSI